MLNAIIDTLNQAYDIQGSAALWFYLSALAVLVGAELNAEIEHASPHRKDPGENVIDTALPPARPAAVTAPASRPPRPSDWILGGLVLTEAAVLAYVKLRSRFNKITP